MAEPNRRKIILDFAAWTALSALRSGSPLKSRADIYPILQTLTFQKMLDPEGPTVLAAAFEAWHRSTTLDIQRQRPELSVGWAAKLVNVYLKTAAYVGDLGPSLRPLLHPPIDGGLWDGLKRRFPKHQLLKKTHAVRTIKDIRDYDKEYLTIIAGCREAASELNCLLIEVEHLWEGTLFQRLPRTDL